MSVEERAVNALRAENRDIVSRYLCSISGAIEAADVGLKIPGQEGSS